MNAHRRNSWAFPVCFSISLLLVLGSATFLFPKHRRPDNHFASRQQARLILPASVDRFAKTPLPEPGQDLLFDPVLVYSTYLGGASSVNFVPNVLQFAAAIVADASGNLYVAGSTNSRSFPVTAGVVEPNNPQKNVLGFLAKLDPTGQTLLFSTYIDGLQGVTSMALDANGDIYVAGMAAPANSIGVPVLPIPQGSTPFVSTPRGIGVVKLNATATAVLAATYLGGSGGDTISGIAVEPGVAGSNLYASGQTSSNDFQTTQTALQPSIGSSGNNLFVTVLDPALSTAVYSTYLGQNSSAFGTVGAQGISVDTSGDAYVVGTANPGFPTLGGPLQATCPDQCGTISKLNPTGTALIYSTYLGTGGARANAVAVDSSKNIYIEGDAATSSGITEVNPVPGFVPCATPHTGSGFVSEINAAGSLAFSSCVIGSIPTIAIDGSGNVAITGVAANGFPLQNPIQSNAAGEGDTYVSTINPSNGSLVFSSFLGNGLAGVPNILNVNPNVKAIAFDLSGNLYAAGYGNSFPIFNALQPVPAGGDPPCPVMNPCSAGTNVDILKVAPSNAAAAALSSFALTFPAQALGTPSAAQTVTVLDMGSAPLSVSNVSPSGDFAVQNGCTSVVSAAGGICPLQVVFTPTALGTRTGTLTITDSSAGSPRTVQLTGLGGQAIATLSPNPLSVTQAVNTTGISKITLTNSGTLPLLVTGIQTSGATFSETNTCGTSVDAGQSCDIAVSFTPTSVANFTGTLTVSDSASIVPQTVALTGTGVADNIGLGYASGSGVSSSTTPAGSVALTSIHVGGGGLSGTVNFSCSGLPQGVTCAFAPSTVSMKPNATTEVQVTIATTARSLLFIPIGIITALLMLATLTGLRYFKGTAMDLLPRLRWRLVPLFALAICACGGGGGGNPPTGGSSSSNGTPAGSYTVVITATSAGSTQTLNFGLTVK